MPGKHVYFDEKNIFYSPSATPSPTLSLPSLPSSSSLFTPPQFSIEEDINSGIQPIIKPLKDGLVSSDCQNAQLFIDLYPAQDLSPAIDDSDASLRPLIKYTEGNSFDLRGISTFLSSPDTDPNLQCAALQLLEHAAEWQSANFTECIPVTFGPVANLILDSRGIQVHCAALDTLKVFLASPHADIVKSMIPPGVIDAVSDDLNSPEPFVQLASVELLDIASRSEGILIGFAAAVSRISSALSSMPTDTQVTALRVLEISADSNTHELVKAVADTCHYLNEPLSSPETTIQIAALKVLEAGAGTEDPGLARAFKNILSVVKKIQSSGETDVHSAARQVDTYDDQQASRSVGHENDMTSPTPLPPNELFLQHNLTADMRFPHLHHEGTKEEKEGKEGEMWLRARESVSLVLNAVLPTSELVQLSEAGKDFAKEGEAARAVADPAEGEEVAKSEDGQDAGMEVGTGEKLWHTVKSTVTRVSPLLRTSLAIIGDVSKLTPIPGLHEAARLLLAVWEAVDTVETNRIQCLRLTERCATSIFSVRSVIADAERDMWSQPGALEDDRLAKEMERTVWKLNGCVRMVYDFLLKLNRRQFLRSDEIQQEILACDTALGDAMHMFNTSIQTRLLKEFKRFAREKYKLMEAGPQAETQRALTPPPPYSSPPTQTMPTLLEQENDIPRRPAWPYNSWPYISSFQQFQIHPLLNGETYGSDLYFDISNPAFAPWRRAGQNHVVMLPVDKLREPATFPTITSMRITHDAIPQWPIDLQYVHGEYDVRNPLPLTVGDVLWMIHSSLQRQISHQDWARLSQSEEIAIARAYIRRYRSIPSLAKLEASQGVKRVDYLMDRHVFRGLIRAADGNGFYHWRLLT